MPLRNWVGNPRGEMGVKCAVSPLHDKDVKPDARPRNRTGHVVFAYDGKRPKTKANARLSRRLARGLRRAQPVQHDALPYAQKGRQDQGAVLDLDVLTFGGYEYKRYVETKRTKARHHPGKNGGKFSRWWRDYGLNDFADLAEYLMQEDTELFAITMRKNVFLRAVPQVQEGTGEGQ